MFHNTLQDEGGIFVRIGFQRAAWHGLQYGTVREPTLSGVRGGSKHRFSDVSFVTATRLRTVLCGTHTLYYQKLKRSMSCGILKRELVPRRGTEHPGVLRRCTLCGGANNIYIDVIRRGLKHPICQDHSYVCDGASKRSACNNACRELRLFSAPFPPHADGKLCGCFDSSSANPLAVRLVWTKVLILRAEADLWARAAAIRRARRGILCATAPRCSTRISTAVVGARRDNLWPI